MNNLTSLKETNIASYIYFIRGEKVMLDVGLANLYEVETRALKPSFFCLEPLSPPPKRGSLSPIFPFFLPAFGIQECFSGTVMKRNSSTLTSCNLIPSSIIDFKPKYPDSCFQFT